MKEDNRVTKVRPFVTSMSTKVPRNNTCLHNSDCITCERCQAITNLWLVLTGEPGQPGLPGSPGDGGAGAGPGVFVFRCSKGSYFMFLSMGFHSCTGSYSSFEECCG